MGFFIIIILALLFLCFAGTSIIASLFYRIFPYRKNVPLHYLPRWERWCLFFIAVYPILSLAGVIGIISIDGQAALSQDPRNPLNSPVPFFCTQTLLTAYGIAVCHYLREQYRPFRFLYVPVILCGTFFFLATWMSMD